MLLCPVLLTATLALSASAQAISTAPLPQQHGRTEAGARAAVIFATLTAFLVMLLTVCWVCRHATCCRSVNAALGRAGPAERRHVWENPMTKHVLVDSDDDEEDEEGDEEEFTGTGSDE